MSERRKSLHEIKFQYKQAKPLKLTKAIAAFQRIARLGPSNHQVAMLLNDFERHQNHEKGGQSDSSNKSDDSHSSQDEKILSEMPSYRSIQRRQSIQMKIKATKQNKRSIMRMTQLITKYDNP